MCCSFEFFGYLDMITRSYANIDTGIYNGYDKVFNPKPQSYTNPLEKSVCIVTYISDKRGCRSMHTYMYDVEEL